MAENISNLSFEVSQGYARLKQSEEKFNQEYKVDRSGGRTVAVQAEVRSAVPTPTSLAALLGTGIRILWTKVTAPLNFYSQRVSNSNIAPSLGPSEMQDADIRKIEALAAIQKDTKAEAEVLVQLLEHGVKKTNEDILYIHSRMLGLLAG